MPLYMSQEELQRSDVASVVARADAYIKDLVVQVETHKARADAAIINAEQTCSLVEQKYVALLVQVSQLENEKAQLGLSLEAKSSELAQAQAQTHQAELKLMKRDSDVESHALEVKELHKARKEMLDVIEKKNMEMDEKNATMRQYLEKVLALTEERSNLESKIHEQMAEMTRLRTNDARLTQEKEIANDHNSWLNQELQSKTTSLLEERQRNAQFEAELQARIMDLDRSFKEKEEALSQSQDRVKELEAESRVMIEEVRFLKEDAATKEEHLSTEVATASKLADLYKKSSEEWSSKANQLEGVIKALEVHLNQCKAEHEERLQKEVELREAVEKEFGEAKEKYEKKIQEAQRMRNIDGGQHMALSISDDVVSNGQDSTVALPDFPYGVSTTALQATLFREGWTLVSVYSKYQEALDAWRHERQERTRSQALLEKVLREIETKGVKILEERAEYSRMLDAYVVMEEKIMRSMSDQASLQHALKDVKAELRKKERDLAAATKDVSDLQTQVSVLLKECLDIQKRHGIAEDVTMADDLPLAIVPDVTSADAIISERLVAFKDIHGLVELNSQLRSLVRTLADQNESKEQELKEEFERHLNTRIAEATEKVGSVLKKAEEQESMIETLKGTVGMYKRLYEEECSIRSTFAVTPRTDIGGSNLRRVMDVSQDEFRKQLQEFKEQISSLEEELTKARSNVTSARANAARAEAEAAFAKEKLSSLTRESENQRKQMEYVLKRNMEVSQTITDYQRKLRENYQQVQAAEEQARRLSIEVSVLEREKELLRNAEQRAAQEASQLSVRVHRLQATLDTYETTSEVREASRMEEKKKLQEEMIRMQKEWVEARHELDLERNFVRNITAERDKAVERGEGLNLELKEAIAALSVSETRIKVLEARCADLETNLRRADDKIMVVLAGGKKPSGSQEADDEILSTLHNSREEIEMLKEELGASKAHAEQYKLIAQANEEALKKMEEAHSRFKEEASKSKDVMDSELKLLQNHLSEVETYSLEKEKEAGALQANREELLRNALKEVAMLKESEASKQAIIDQAEARIQVLKEDLEKQHKERRQAQNNYERQVMSQADTIRELNAVNERLGVLESDANNLRERAEKAEAELESVKVAFYMEKASLEAAGLAMEQRLKDVDEQNRFLLDRLEAKQISLAEQGRANDEGQSREFDSQHVLQYLRRSKEAADTEITLLKQERTRLTKQFEAASRAAEEAQAKLRQHHENILASVYTDEEFRALQTQVMEMNLVRENNVQVREENKKLSEENKGLRDRLSKVEEELETSNRFSRERLAELGASASEIESLKKVIQQWEQRFSQMIAKYKALDVDDYERIKVLLREAQERIKELETQAESQAGEMLMKFEREKTEHLAEAEKKLHDSEVLAKAEIDKLKKLAMTCKRKMDTANKEKETLLKELEDYRAAHQEAAEVSQKESAARLDDSVSRLEQAQKDIARNEQALKETSQRAQVLEKSLEKERDELRKERIKREKDRKHYLETTGKMSADLQQVRLEFEQYRQERPDPSRISIEPVKAEAEQSDQLNVTEMPSRADNEPSIPSIPVPEPCAVPTIQPLQPLTEGLVKTPLTKAVDIDRNILELRANIHEKEREKEKQTRRQGRRFVRPQMDRANQADTSGEAGEPSVDEGTVEGEMEIAVVRVSDAVDMEMGQVASSAHKRSSPESMDVTEDDSHVPHKKLKSSDQDIEAETMTERSTVPAAEEVKPADLDISEPGLMPQPEVPQDMEASQANEKSPEAEAGLEVDDVVTMEDDTLEAGEVREQAEQEAGQMQVEQGSEATGVEAEPPQGEGADNEGDVEDGEIGAGEEGVEGEVEQETGPAEEQVRVSEEKKEDNNEREGQMEETGVATQVDQGDVPENEKVEGEKMSGGEGEKAVSGVGEKTVSAEGEKVSEKAGAAGEKDKAPIVGRTINISNRARERALTRERGARTVQPPASPPPAGRGGGRARTARRGGGRAGSAGRSPTT